MQCMTNAMSTGESWTPNPVLEENSWGDIKRASDEGIASSVFAIGDIKSVLLNGRVGILDLNTTLYVFILGFDHNAELEGPGITFGGFKSAVSNGVDVCLVDSQFGTTGTSVAFRMNTSNSNVGGWENSFMRNNICGTNLENYANTFLEVMPEDLRVVLRPITKYTNNVGQSISADAITASIEYCFILSEFEVFGLITYANTYEANFQKQYDFYISGNSKVKYRHSNTGNLANWHLRSPQGNSSARFTRVVTTGKIGYYNANYSTGFSPCFVV